MTLFNDSVHFARLVALILLSYFLWWNIKTKANKQNRPKFFKEIIENIWRILSSQKSQHGFVLTEYYEKSSGRKWGNSSSSQESSRNFGAQIKEAECNAQLNKKFIKPRSMRKREISLKLITKIIGWIYFWGRAKDRLRWQISIDSTQQSRIIRSSWLSHSQNCMILDLTVLPEWPRPMVPV